MRYIPALIGLAASACAAVASAAPQTISDVQFIEASRCLGLMTSTSLASPDAARLGPYVDQQSWTRIPVVMDMADAARDSARLAAARASGYERAQLIAERDGVCRAFGAPTTAAAATSAGRSLQ